MAPCSTNCVFARVPFLVIVSPRRIVPCHRILSAWRLWANRSQCNESSMLHTPSPPHHHHTTQGTISKNTQAFQHHTALSNIDSSPA
ncbi:hypothetical protein HDV57DRAFT_324781 [Trichoderma longibrachiatum]|uniref:Uncharacterized protein n=1 Tax=Trichoderma longibrachiatum ATCC 18648 TaxID=983965 RepID=A0A2T4BVY3_TRILO|nr:hypothetical protein M440DRAFT_132194 [Trichoderma longibrachiatum ATCC 18648]